MNLLQTVLGFPYPEGCFFNVKDYSVLIYSIQAFTFTWSIVRGGGVRICRLREFYHGPSGEAHACSGRPLLEEESGCQGDLWCSIAAKKTGEVITVDWLEDVASVRVDFDDFSPLTSNAVVDGSLSSMTHGFWNSWRMRMHHDLDLFVNNIHWCSGLWLCRTEVTLFWELDLLQWKVV